MSKILSLGNILSVRAKNVTTLCLIAGSRFLEGVIDA
jgi:hypothetical protein